jgi:hypothetical protein
LVGSAIRTDAFNDVQTPVPFAAKRVEFPQFVWSSPAFAKSRLFDVMKTLSIDIHAPFVTVHTRVSSPVKFDTVLNGFDGSATRTAAFNDVQIPVPFVGLVAAKTVELSQMFWSCPAFAIERIFDVIKTLSTDVQAPIVTVQTSVSTPKDKFDTALNGLDGSAIRTEAFNDVQTPVPFAGLLAAMSVEFPQIVRSSPAFVTNRMFDVIKTLSTDEQIPFVTVQISVSTPKVRLDTSVAGLAGS